MVRARDILERHLHGALAGSRADIDRVMEVMLPQVRMMVAARLGATAAQFHVVQDLTQITMVALHDGLDRLQVRTVRGLNAYTSRIVAHKVADHLRGRAPTGLERPRLKSLDSTIGGLSFAAPLWQVLSMSGAGPPSRVSQADEVAAVLAAVTDLKPAHREVVTLAFFDQLTTADIAEQLGITRPAATMLLIRAIKALRRTLTGSSQAPGPNGTPEVAP